MFLCNGDAATGKSVTLNTDGFIQGIAQHNSGGAPTTA